MIGIRIPQGLLSASKDHQKTGNGTSEYWTWPANLVVVPLSFWAQGEHQSKPVAREIQEPGSLRHLISYSHPLRRIIRTSANQRIRWHGKTTTVWSCRRVSHPKSWVMWLFTTRRCVNHGDLKSDFTAGNALWLPLEKSQYLRATWLD